jgi:hypothetical protein
MACVNEARAEAIKHQDALTVKGSPSLLKANIWDPNHPLEGTAFRDNAEHTCRCAHRMLTCRGCSCATD